VVAGVAAGVVVVGVVVVAGGAVCAGVVVVVVGVVVVVAVCVGVVDCVDAVGVADGVPVDAPPDCWLTSEGTTGAALLESGAVITRSARAASFRFARR
jgi:hypothetical protein